LEKIMARKKKKGFFPKLAVRGEFLKHGREK
jgi:hypothetical protein